MLPILRPRVRLVSSRTRLLNRCRLLEWMRIFGAALWCVNPKPRYFEYPGWITLLFVSLTFSLSFRLMKRVMLSFTRSPALAFDIDDTVIGVAHELQPAPFKLLVELIQHDV